MNWDDNLVEARPGFVEWHKHRGLWRYFQRFEAPRRGALTRMAVWAAIWAHWASRLPAIARDALVAGR